MRRGDVAAWLSKSDFLTGLQCKLALWLRKHAPDEAAPPRAAQRIRFRDGNLVDAHARDAFPGGVYIDERGFRACADATRWAIAEGVRRLYQATFSSDWGGCMVDVLDREDNGTWTLREVKSTTSVKQIHVHDAAFQAMVLLDGGYDVARAVVVHIDSERSAPDPRGFLHDEDVSAEVNEHLASLPSVVDELRQVVDGPEPDVPIGLHCEVPYACPFKPRCWSDVPRASVFTIPDIGADRLNAFVGSGITALDDIPSGKRLPRAMRAYVDLHRSGPVLHPKRLSAWVSSLLYPLRFVYIVTEHPPLPRHYRMRPYDPVPVAIVCRTLHADGRISGASARFAGDGNPLEVIARALVEAVGEGGHVVTWGADTTRALLSALKGAVPEQSTALARIRDRLRDLQEVAEVAIRDPRRLGSNELSDVAHALLGAEANVPTDAELLWHHLQALDAAADEDRARHAARLESAAARVADALVSVHAWMVDTAGRHPAGDNDWVPFDARP